ncbi:hypothetical protein BH11PLA2_BH11PLA2_18110 [soil metagenome]
MADDKFFDTHVTKTAETQPAEKDDTAATQGWIGRNCTLKVKDGALVIAHDAKVKEIGFITFNKLDLPGPVSL